MKLLKNILISITFLTVLAGIISSCGQQEYDRVFRYYFEAELDSAYTRIRKAVEGEEEGLYRVGSKAIYQHKADSLKEIGMRRTSTMPIWDCWRLKTFLKIQRTLLSVH